MPSTGSERVSSSDLQTPRPQVLAGLTDSHFLMVLAGSDDPLSRAEVADRSGLSKPAISAAAARLLDRSVIRETGIREGRRGGVATLLTINPDHGYSLAVAVESDGVHVRARDFAGRVVSSESAALEHGATQPEVIRITNSAIAAVATKRSAALLAATVSIADPIDSATGSPVILGRSAFPAGRFNPRTALDLEPIEPLVVDNDVNWATLAERQGGPLREYDDFVYVYCGRGLGAGLFLGGQLYRGHRGLAGEIGYLHDSSEISLDLTQRLGRLGLSTGGGYALDLDDVSQIFQGERPTASGERILDLLAVSVANLITTLNPRAIALGGPLTRSRRFSDELRSRILPLTIDAPAIVVTDSTPLDGASNEAHRIAFAAASPVNFGTR